MKKNTISVIIPAHNEEDVIAKAINSVLKSTYKKYEIVVVNNGSTDHTKEVVEKFIKKYPRRITLLNYEPVSDKELAEKRGAAFSRNRGAEAARGDILFFLDADDWVREDTLENIAKAFEKYKGVDFIIRNREVVIPDNWRRIFVFNFIIFKDKIFSSEKNVKEKILTETGHCICAARTKNFKEIGGFDEKYFYSEDNELGRRLEKMKIKKLISSKVIYYTDMGTTFKDFKRLCKNVAFSRSLDLPEKYSINKVLYQTILFVIIFPLFYLSLFMYSYYKCKDLLVSSMTPLLLIIKRILIIYYFIRLKISNF